MKRACEHAFLFLTTIVLFCQGCKEIAIPPAGSYSELLVATEEGRASEFLPKILSLVAFDKDYIIYFVK